MLDSSQQYRPWIFASCMMLAACTDTVVNIPPDTNPGDTTATETDLNAATTGSDASTPEPDTGNMTQAASSADTTATDASTLESDTGNMTQAASAADTTATDASTLEPDTGNMTQAASAVDATETDVPALTPDSSNMTQSTSAADTGNSGDSDSQPVPGSDTGLMEDLADSPSPATPATTPNVSIAPVTDLQAPQDNTIVGSPGQSVDCQQSLPCRWISADNQFSITVTSADNIADRQRLKIQYSVDTVHDTQVAVVRTEEAIDARGISFIPSNQTLGSGNGITPQAVLAGTSISGQMDFDKGSTSMMISSWSIGMTDNGLLRSPAFTGIPLGTVTTQYADCADTLPCSWVSPDSNVQITLLSVGGFSANNRLTANFIIETGSSMTLAVDAGSSASGSDGTPFSGRTHSLGTSTSFEKISSNIAAGTRLAGSVSYFRTETAPTSLQELVLIIYEDNPVPRWNPRFASVPVL